MRYKVCILAAGKNQNVRYGEDFPITLLPTGKKAAITRIIEKFPKDVEIVIAVGYKEKLIKDFVKIAHSERKITFVEVPDYSKPGSGPGKTLLMCKNHLRCPFIFTSADTLIMDDIPGPDKNWIGVSSVSDSTNYCMAEVENDKVTKLYVKVDTPTLLKTCRNYRNILNNAFVGMAGIFDHITFWEGLEADTQLIERELQVSNGLTKLIEKKITPVTFFNWFDIGNETGYNLACRFFESNNVLEKPDEFIYFENGKVIKYFGDKEVVKQRIQRAHKLKAVTPRIVDSMENFYSYDFIEGKTLAEVNDSLVFKQMLEYLNKTIWVKKNLDNKQHEEFNKLCRDMYYNKTMSRLNKFFIEQNHKDENEIINGEKIPAMRELLKKINWERLFDGVPVNFHGDPQPENILICKKGFQLIDWRHSFSGSIEHGDLYYDFAKLYHALIVTHRIIRENQFEIRIDKNNINFEFLLKSNLIEYKDLFERFIKKKGYDLDRVRILGALTFINIAPLHHYPYNFFLYYLGKYSIFKELEYNNSYKLKEHEVTIRRDYDKKINR